MESWIYQLPVAVTTIVLAIVGGGIAYGKLSSRIEQISDEQKKIKEQEEKLLLKYDVVRDDVKDIKAQQKLDALEIKNTLMGLNNLLQTSLGQMSKDMSSLSDRIEEANNQVAALHHQEHSHAKELRARMGGIETTLALMRGILHGSGFGVPSSTIESSEHFQAHDPLMSPTPSKLTHPRAQQKQGSGRRQPVDQDG